MLERKETKPQQKINVCQLRDRSVQETSPIDTNYRRRYCVNIYGPPATSMVLSQTPQRVFSTNGQQQRFALPQQINVTLRVV